MVGMSATAKSCGTRVVHVRHAGGTCAHVHVMMLMCQGRAKGSPECTCRACMHTCAHVHLRHARGGAVEPWRRDRAALLELTNLIHLLEREPDVVKAVEEAVLAEGVDLERVRCAVVADHLLRWQVNLELSARVGISQQLNHLLAGQDEGQHAWYRVRVRVRVRVRG